MAHEADSGNLIVWGQPDPEHSKCSGFTSTIIETYAQGQAPNILGITSTHWLPSPGGDEYAWVNQSPGFHLFDLIGIHGDFGTQDHQNLSWEYLPIGLTYKIDSDDYIASSRQDEMFRQHEGQTSTILFEYDWPQSLPGGIEWDVEGLFFHAYSISDRVVYYEGLTSTVVGRTDAQTSGIKGCSTDGNHVMASFDGATSIYDLSVVKFVWLSDTVVSEVDFTGDRTTLTDCTWTNRSNIRTKGGTRQTRRMSAGRRRCGRR